MFGLLVTVCSLAAPEQCERHVQPLHGANELSCLMIGQAEVARTLRPGWRVTRYGCTRLAPSDFADLSRAPAVGAPQEPH